MTIIFYIETFVPSLMIAVLIFYLKQSDDENKFLYSNILTLASILIAVMFIIYQSTGTFYLAAAHDQGGFSNPSLINDFIQNCRSGGSQPHNITLSKYYNYSTAQQILILGLCIPAWATRYGIEFTLTLIFAILSSLTIRVIVKKLHEKHKRLHSILTILMWTFLIWVIVVSIVQSLSFLGLW